MAESKNDAKLVIVDTDVGVDDACALLLLLGRHERPVNLLAITTVRGNVGVDHVCSNVLRTLRIAGRLDIPVYRGTDTSYIGVQGVTATFYHGNDGLGDVPDLDTPDSSLIQEEHAASALVRLVNEYSGQISLVCLAPLTNIAVAMKLDEDFGKKLSDCFIMGGNYEGKGNITTSAEFNFYSDPEAADVVLRHLRCPITLITWELSLASASSWDWFNEFISTDTARGRFVRSITSKSIDTFYSDGMSTISNEKYITCDEIAAAVAIDDRIATDVTEVVVCGVERTGHLTRGQLIVDWNRSKEDGATATVRLVKRIDRELFERLLLDSLSVDSN